VGYSKNILFIQSFGQNLRKIRKDKGFTQEQLANDADLGIRQISRIERGIINTSISQVFEIAQALKNHPKELFNFPSITKT